MAEFINIITEERYYLILANEEHIFGWPRLRWTENGVGVLLRYFICSMEIVSCIIQNPLTLSLYLSISVSVCLYAHTHVFGR